MNIDHCQKSWKFRVQDLCVLVKNDTDLILIRYPTGKTSLVNIADALYIVEDVTCRTFSGN